MVSPSHKMVITFAPLGFTALLLDALLGCLEELFGWQPSTNKTNIDNNKYFMALKYKLYTKAKLSIGSLLHLYCIYEV